MDWEIYSIGDGAFLERILNSVAMLNGGGDIQSMAAIGFLIGALMVGMKAIVDGGRMPQFQYLLVAWLVYAGMFGSTTTVQITDVYKDEVRVVDNVPIGVAATGHLISNIGFTLTELFEQSFGMTQMTDDGFGYALDALAAVRTATLTKDDWGSANSAQPGEDIWKSWSNYIKECTLTGVDNGEYTVTDIMSGNRNGGVLQQLRYSNAAFGTRLYLDDSGSGYYDCDEAYDRLAAETDSSVRQRIGQVVAREMGFGQQDMPPSGAAAAQEAEFTVTGALQTLNLSGQNAQDYMLATAMYPIFSWGLAANELDFQRVTHATMAHDAIQQRNSQWAAEQALFESVVHPIMTFFEGFIFAVTPLMAFIIALGPVGISVVVKYWFIILWIQLWMPTLAIVNLFLHMAASREMNALREGRGFDDVAISSFAGIQAMDQELQQWIATGGMLASSVPAITLMLLYGSAVTATNLSSRLQSGDYIDEKKTTPDSFQNGSGLQIAARTQSDRMTGLRATRYDSQLASISGATGFQESVQSADAERSARAEEFSNTLSQNASSGFTFNKQASNQLSDRFSESAGFTQGDQLVDKVESTLERNGVDTSKLSRAEMRSIGAQAGIGANLNGSSAGMSAEQRNALGISEEQSQNIMTGLSDSIGNDETLKTEISEQVAQDYAQGRGDIYNEALGVTDSDSVQEAAKESYEASETYQELSSMSTSSNINKSMNAMEAATKIRNDESLRSQLSEWTQSPEGVRNNGLIETRAEENERGGMTEDQARVAAEAQTFAEQPSTESGRFVADLLDFDSGQVPDRDQVDSNRGVSDAAADPGSVQEAVEERNPGTGVPDAEDVRADVRGETGRSVEEGLTDANRENRGKTPQELNSDANEAIVEERGESANEQSKDQVDRDIKESTERTERLAEDSRPSFMSAATGLFTGGLDTLSSSKNEVVEMKEDAMKRIDKADDEGWFSSRDVYDTPGTSGERAADQTTTESLLFDEPYLGDSRVRESGMSVAADTYERNRERIEEANPDMPAPISDYLAYTQLAGPRGSGNTSLQPYLREQGAEAKTALYATYGSERAESIMASMDNLQARGVTEQAAEQEISRLENTFAEMDRRAEEMGGTSSEAMRFGDAEQWQGQREELLAGLDSRAPADSVTPMERYMAIRDMGTENQQYLQPELAQAQYGMIDNLGYEPATSVMQTIDQNSASAPNPVGGGDVSMGGAASSTPAAGGGRNAAVSSDPLTGSALSGAEPPAPGFGGQQTNDPEVAMAGPSDPANQSLANDISVGIQYQQTLDQLEGQLGPNPSPEARLQAMNNLPYDQQELLSEEIRMAEEEQRQGQSWS